MHKPSLFTNVLNQFATLNWFVNRYFYFYKLKLNWNEIRACCTQTEPVFLPVRHPAFLNKFKSSMLLSIFYTDSKCFRDMKTFATES